MDAKTLKLFDILINQTSDFTFRKTTAIDFVKALAEISYENGVFAALYLNIKAPKIFEYDTIRDSITIDALELLLEKNRPKTVKLLISDDEFRSCFYGKKTDPFSGSTLEVLLNLLVLNKLSDSENIFKAILKNPYCDYGKGMVFLFDQYLKILIAKQGGITLRPDIPKKTAELFTLYAGKIKGEEKSLLLQRIKELL